MDDGLNYNKKLVDFAKECEINGIRKGRLIMGGAVVSRKAKKKIQSIFEHPDNVYSIYLKNCEDVVWVSGEQELYEFLHRLNNKEEKINL